MAEETIKETKKKEEKPKTTMVKILTNPNDKDLSEVPVTINNQEWHIPVGKPTEVPTYVARILENAGYI